MKKKTKKNRISIDLLGDFRLISALLVIFIVFLLTSVSLGFSINSSLAENLEAARPADIEITKITYSPCTDCFDIDAAINQVKAQNVEITNEQSLDADSPEAMGLIQRFNIQKLPTFIIGGETDKTAELKAFFESLGENVGGDIIFRSVAPPYYDPLQAKVMGRVSAIRIIDSSCANCIDIEVLASQIRSLGISFETDITVEYGSPEATELIEKYSIQRIPALILSEDAGLYSNLATVWNQIGTIIDASYVINNIPLAPYVDASTGETKGLVDVIYLTDESCETCYDVSVHKNILTKSYGVVLSSEETYDVSSEAGADIVSKYELTKVPTFLVSPEAEAYTQLVSLWPQLGTTEDDGWYVFRNVEVLGDTIYKDLSTGETVGG